MIFLADDFSFVLVSNFMVILAKVNFLLQKSNTYFLFLRKTEKRNLFQVVGQNSIPGSPKNKSGCRVVK